MPMSVILMGIMGGQTQVLWLSVKYFTIKLHAKTQMSIVLHVCHYLSLHEVLSAWALLLCFMTASSHP